MQFAKIHSSILVVKVLPPNYRHMYFFGKVFLERLILYNAIPGRRNGFKKG